MQWQSRVSAPETRQKHKDKPLDQIIVADWLSTRLEMTLMRVKPSSSNQYVFDDATMSHGELMNLLKTNYSENRKTGNVNPRPFLTNTGYH